MQSVAVIDVEDVGKMIECTLLLGLKCCSLPEDPEGVAEVFSDIFQKLNLYSAFLNPE